MISSDQLRAISENFDVELSYPTSCLIYAIERPHMLIVDIKKCKFWSIYEKLLLVTCWVKFKKIQYFTSMVNRSICACQKEFSRIIKSLQLVQAPCPEETKPQNLTPYIFVFKESYHKISEENDKITQNFVPKQLFVHEIQRNQNQLRLNQLCYARNIKKIKNENMKENMKENMEENIKENENETKIEKLSSTLDFLTDDDFLNVIVDTSLNFGSGTGKRYSSSSKTFWIRLMLYSRKAYSMMKSYLNGPSESTINLWTKETTNIPNCNQLEDLSQINETFLFWTNKLGISIDDCFTLSIDAAKVDENLSITSDGIIGGTMKPIELKRSPEDYRNNSELYNNLWNKLLEEKMLITHIFVFLLCPISSKRAFPIFIQFSNSGAATNSITNNLDTIINQLKSNGVKIRFVGSDSDQCYRGRFNEQFNNIMNTWNNSLLDLSQIPENEVMYTNDAYHCLKRLRKAMVNSNGLYLRPSDVNTSMCVSKSSLQQIDQSLPNCIFRTGSMVSMDDYYPSALFNFSTLKKARDSDNYAATIYLMVGNLTRKVMASKKLNRTQRCILCYTGLYIVVFYKMFLDTWKKDNIPKKILSKMILSPELCVDLANFYCSMIKALTTIPESFPLSRISSILSEHFFGRIRGNAGNCQTAEAVRSTINKIEFIDAYRNDLNFDDMNHRRKLETGIAEQGLASVSNWDILKCKEFVQYLFYVSGLYPKNGEILYELLMRPIYTNPYDYIYDLLGEKERKEKGEKEEKERKIRWTLNAAQFRVNGRYGRNIKMRYATTAKLNQ